MLSVKRIYDHPENNDGFRILIDRLWPRGIKKETAGIDTWFKNIAPSTELRREFHQHPEKWPEFRKRYLEELKHNDSTAELIDLVNNHPIVTLLYASRDEKHNHAIILRDFLAGSSG